MLDLINKNNEQTLLFTQIGINTDNNLNQKFTELVLNVNSRSSQMSTISGNIGELLGMVGAVSKGLEKVSLGNNSLEISINESNRTILDSLKLLGDHIDPIVIDDKPTSGKIQEIPSSKRKRDFEDFARDPLKRHNSAPELEYHDAKHNYALHHDFRIPSLGNNYWFPLGTNHDAKHNYALHHDFRIPSLGNNYWFPLGTNHGKASL